MSPTLVKDIDCGAPVGLTRALTELLDHAERDVRRTKFDPLLFAFERRRSLQEIASRISHADAVPSPSGVHHTRFALLLIEVLRSLYQIDPNEIDDVLVLQLIGSALLPMVRRDAERAMVEERGG